MAEERWLPLKHQLPDGTHLGKLLHSGFDWQIFRAGRDNKVLIARPPLAERWISSRLLPDTILKHFSFGGDCFNWLQSGARQRLEPVECGNSLDSKMDGLSFALSLRETRKIEKEASLHDAIYAERYSRLLPTWSISEEVPDEKVLGSWLTGGVSVAVTSFRRLSNLLGWLDKKDVRDLVQAAGFETPQEQGGIRIRTEKPDNEGAVTERETLKTAVHHENIGSELTGHPFRLSGRPALEAFFNEHVIEIIMDPDRYKAFGIHFPTAIVLHGPPGCGKTFAVERLVEYLDWPIFYVDSNSVGSPFIHETSRKIGEVFEKAIDASPSMVVIDEMESYLSDRQIHQSTGLHHVEEVGEFLRRIPEANEHCVLVVGMTNRLEMIDPAILRRGRFDHVIEVGMPSIEEISELVEGLLQKMPISEQINNQKLAHSLTGRALSDVSFVVREAARLAARSGKSALDEMSLQSALRNLPAQKLKKRQIGFIQD